MQAVRSNSMDYLDLIFLQHFEKSKDCININFERNGHAFVHLVKQEQLTVDHVKIFLQLSEKCGQLIKSQALKEALEICENKTDDQIKESVPKMIRDYAQNHGIGL